MADFIVTGAKKPLKKDPTYTENKHDLTKCTASFHRHILTTPISEIKPNLISLSLNSDLTSNYIRPIAWKIMLNILPTNPEATLKTWLTTTISHRQKYKTKVKQLKTLKKYDSDPLGGGNSQQWQSFFEDTEIKKLIILDVSRTYQEKDLFNQQFIKDILVNILFIWAKEHKVPSYKQGMNEILAVILYAMFPFYTKNNCKQSDIETYITNPSEHTSELYGFFHDEKEFECDLYYLYSSIMDKCITKFYESGSNVKGGKMYLHERCDLILKDKLQYYDAMLYKHFERIEIDCSMVVQRWLKCLFNREFHVENVIVIWDLILADEAKGNGKDLEMIDFVSLALIQFIRGMLISKEQNDCFQRLFRYPPVESIETIIELAKKIKEDFMKRPKESEKKENNEDKKKEVKGNVIQKQRNVNVDPLSGGLKGNDNNNNVSNVSKYKDVTESLPKSLLVNKGNVSNNNISSNQVQNVKVNQTVVDNNNNKKKEHDNNNNNEVNLSEQHKKELRSYMKELQSIFSKYRMNMQLSDIGKMEETFDKIKDYLQ